MRKSTIFPSVGALAAAATLGAWVLFDAPRQVQADPAPGLPEEAYAACQSKSAGDACFVPFGPRQMEGSCAQRAPDARLFCRLKPPPEALAACAGKNVADACTVSMGAHVMNGTCVKEPDGEQLVCAPPHPAGPPQ